MSGVAQPIERHGAFDALASLAFLTPAFGVILGGLLLAEPGSARSVAALGMIAVGIVPANRPSQRQPRG